MEQQQSFGRGFEDEVRRVARLLWPSSLHQGATIRMGRERDMLIETDDAIHVLECTLLRTKAKAAEDIDKTSKLVSQLRRQYPDKIVKGWFISKDELTADQNDVASHYKRTVTALPFKDFLARLVDARAYLSFREKCPFGSVANPVTNHFEVPRDEYVPPSFYNDKTMKSVGFDNFFLSVAADTSRAVLLGDYGAGKSMALRELFFRAANNFYKGQSTRFPVYINLRNHLGQGSPVEALIREAANSGYERYDDLVKAWRADLIILILDGFDELVTPAWTNKASQLREHKAACTKLVAEFVRESPSKTPLIISGRFSYFGSDSELRKSLRLQDGYTTFRLNDFTKEQAEELLRKLSVSVSLPEWLPSRPLLLGYFAAYARRNAVDLAVSGVDPAEGWDYLVDRICARETEIQGGLYPEYVRRVMERIATKARYGTSITAPVSQADISLAFREIFGRETDDASLGMLIRLPGLVAVEGSNDDRRFIDSDFADILASGDILEFILAPSAMEPETFERCKVNVGPLGADFVISKVGRLGRPSSIVGSSLDYLANKARLSCLKGDLISTLSVSDVGVREKWTIVDDASVDVLDLRQAPAFFSKLRLVSSAFGIVEIDLANPEGCPVFQSSVVGLLRGPRNLEDLVSYLIDTSVDRVEYEQLTNAAVLDMDIPAALKVGITSLRKLYLQSGGGRQINAFSRGLRPEQRKYVTPVLSTLVSCGYAKVSTRGGDPIYMRVGEKVSEVREILGMGSSAKGEIIDLLKKVA